MVKLSFKQLIVTLGLWLGLSFYQSVYAQNQTFYFWTFKTGTQNTGQPAPLLASQDNYLSAIESDHGKLKGDRQVNPSGVGFDFYRVSGSFASGFSTEVHWYNKEHKFGDASKVQLEAQAVLFALSTFYRAEFWFPYFSFGTGSYNVKIREKLTATNSTPSTKASFNDSARNVLFYEVGSRFPIDTTGILTGYRFTSANVKVQTIGERLELGGQTFFLGFYWSF